MIKLREATLKDAKAVNRIVCLCYEGFGQTDGYPSRVIDELKRTRGSVECIRNLIAGEDMFVADDDGCIKGMVSIRDKEITKLYIDPSYQRNGIGRMLFIRAESFIRDRGHLDMFLGAAAQTPVAFYERMGMRVTDKRRIDCGPCIGMTSRILKKEIHDEASAPSVYRDP